MLSNNNEKQKSPKRRFLLILGVAAFIGLLVFGLLILFWGSFLSQIPQPQKTIFGCVVIVYAVLRFARYLRKDPNEN
jgi:ABC-type Na+ efflux pump permease subunit